MKYYKDTNNEVYAYEDDGSQDYLIGDKVQMTAEEIELHINPPKTQEQILQNKIAEAKTYLSSTDYKMTVDYFATLSQDVQDELIKLRAEARQFLRENEE